MMTRLNFTFQESSPLITYSGWVEGTTADPYASSYDGSFRVTNTDKATASFTYTGTGISLFGATRPNHGNYSVELDQQPLFLGVGFTNSNDFKKSLWHADDLGLQEHAVVLTNIVLSNDKNYLDLDFVSIERQIGEDGDTIFQNSIDDTSPLIHYSGPWEQITGQDTAYKSTLHTTSVADAQVGFTFNGCCLEVYGQYANAPYSVKLDNHSLVYMTGLDVDLSPDLQHPQTLLYLIDGLPEANHTVTLTNTASNGNRPFLFDYAVVSSTKNVSSDGDLGSSTNSVARRQIRAIVGGTIGGAVTLLGMLVLLSLFMRRRRRNKLHSLDLIESSLAEPQPFTLPNHFEPQSTHPAEAFRPMPILVDPRSLIPPSKRHQMADYYPRGNAGSEEGLLSPQESLMRESASYVADSSTMTSSTRLATSESQSRDTKGDVLVLHRPTIGRTDFQSVQEEDAGVVLPLETQLVSGTLPPAYNPEWHGGDRP